jgi:hypothetical protein
VGVGYPLLLSPLDGSEEYMWPMGHVMQPTSHQSWPRHELGRVDGSTGQKCLAGLKFG